MDLAYVTRVEVPSKAAQARQISCMARAFHEQLGDRFQLISSGSSAISSYHRTLRTSSGSGWRRYFEAGWEAANLSKGRRKRVIFTRDIGVALAASVFGGQAVYEAHKEPKGRGARLLTSFLTRWMNLRIVAISKALGDYYEKEFGIPSDQILVAHDGVFPDEYHPVSDEKRNELRKELGLPQDALLVVHTGSLYKGGAELFGSIPAPAGANVLFVHVGGTEEEVAHWSRHYRDLGISHLRLLPHQPAEEARKYQMSADLLFYVTTRQSPIYWCTSPLKLFEYMASGISILGARIGSVTEILDDDNAFCFDPDHPESLTLAFSRFLHDRQGARQKAVRARNDAASLYSWHVRAARIAGFAFSGETSKTQGGAQE